jgi:Domain of unknown function (DUF6438)
MKKLYIFITLLAILAVSCSNYKNFTAYNAIWTIDFKKGGCLDVCQSYSLAIKSTGQYEYKGNFKVKHKGVKKGLLNKTQLSELRSLVATIKWQDMKDSYGNQAEDSQRKDLNYSSGEFKKNINYYRLEPQEIRKLEQLFDTIINHDEF